MGCLLAQRGEERPIRLEQPGFRRVMERGKVVEQKPAIRREVQLVDPGLLREALQTAAIQPHAVELALAWVRVGGHEVDPAALLVQADDGKVLEMWMIDHPVAVGKLFLELSVAAIEIEVQPAVSLREPE